MNLLEIIQTNDYNEYLLNKHYEAKAKEKK